MQNPNPSSEARRVAMGFWTVPAVPRALTCAAILMIGVQLADRFPVPPLDLIVVCAVSLALTAAFRHLRHWRLETVAMLFSGLAMGMLLWGVRSHPDDGQDIAVLADMPEFRDVPVTRIIGDVANIPALNVPKDSAGEPDASDSVRTLLLLNTRALLRGDTPIRARGQVRVLIDGDATPFLSWGDRIELMGQVELPGPPLNPGEFDFGQHLRHHGISAMIFARHHAAARVVQPAGFWNPKYWLTQFRQQTVALLRDNLTPQNRAAAEALLLGNRGHLAPDIERDFIASGTMHLLAISGLHVGILFVFLVRIQNLLLVSRTRSLLLGGLVCVVYALLTDLRPSVMRATCFILLYVLGQSLYRDIRMGSLIGASIMLLLVIDPTMAFDVGAWLSFLAVGALGWVAEHDPPPEDRVAPPDAITWQDQLHEWRGLFLEWLWLSYRRMLAITILAAPLVATQFHVVSLVGMVINILLIPLTMVTLVCGYLSITLGLFIPPVASFAAIPFDWLLSTLQVGVSLAADMRLGFVMIPDLPVWFVPAYYGLLGLSVMARPSILRRCFRMGLLVFVIVVFHWICEIPEHSGLTCSILSVGHGNAVVVETPDDRVLLFDAGAMYRGERTADTLCRFLWHRGHRMIDAVVISHPDLDHYNAVTSLLERMPVGQVWLTNEFARTESSAVRQVLDAISMLRVPVRILGDGDSFSCLDLQCSFFKADVDTESGMSDNEASLAAVLAYRDRRICLPGDLERRGQSEVLPRLPVCDVLMSPHHGSPNSNNAAVASRVQPRYVVVSDRDDRNKDALNAIYTSGTVLHTSLSGCVTIHVTPTGELQVKSFREPLDPGKP